MASWLCWWRVALLALSTLTLRLRGEYSHNVNLILLRVPSINCYLLRLTPFLIILDQYMIKLMVFPFFHLEIWRCLLLLLFFLQHPLLTIKGSQFDIWCQIVGILSTKAHVGKTLEARDNLLIVARLMRDLNSAREHTKKSRRSAVIIEWLESLTDVPTLAQKLSWRL